MKVDGFRALAHIDAGLENGSREMEIRFMVLRILLPPSPSVFALFACLRVPQLSPYCSEFTNPSYQVLLPAHGVVARLLFSSLE